MYGYGSFDSKHKPTIVEIGWGEPPQHHPSCSCGWRGITIDTYPQDQLHPFPEVCLLIEEYGADQVYRGPHIALGEKNDALKQVLIHIDYNPDLDAEYWLNEFNKVFENYSKNIAEKEYAQALSLVKKLSGLNQELVNMEHRIDVFKNHKLTIPKFDAELHLKVEEITKEYAEKSYTSGEPGYLDNA